MPKRSLGGDKGPSFHCQVFLLVLLKKGLRAHLEGGWGQMCKVWVWACDMCVWDVSVWGVCVWGCKVCTLKNTRCTCLQDACKSKCIAAVGAAVGQAATARARAQGWARGCRVAELPLGVEEVSSEAALPLMPSSPPPTAPHGWFSSHVVQLDSWESPF